MNGLLQSDAWLFSPWAWALVTGAVALWCLVPRGRRNRLLIAAGVVLGVISVGLLASRIPVVQPWTEAAMFWLLASITVISAAAMISMRSPVFSAIWFAMALLGTSCLFLLQGAQLLAVATIVVYAGAIVVMFLFLIMLAQPAGHEYYDRISWASPGALFSCVAGAAMVLMLTTAIVGVVDDRPVQADVVAGSPSDAPTQTAADSDGGTQAELHVATLGGVLFSRYLIAVEVAGMLLLIALVGAVAIVMFGREQETASRRRESPPTRGAA